MPRFWNRQRRRHLLLPIVGAVMGGLVVLVIERTLFRPHPVPMPIAFPHVTTAQELDRSVRRDPCTDLHHYVCSIAQTEDPTGGVRTDAEGEVDVLRIYESIIRSNRSLTSEKVDEILVTKVYTPERTRQIRELFAQSKKHLLKFIDSQPFQALTRHDKSVLRERIENVTLELPPPASVYADEPDLFTRNDVYYERSIDGKVRIRIGGALFFTVKSKFNLAFTLAHELAHAIDPCELRSGAVDILSYRGLGECFGSPIDAIATECTARGNLSEIFADWVATHVVADILAESASSFTVAQTRAAIFNAVRDLCHSEETLDFDEKSGLSASHPTVAFRINRVFAQHPAIRKYLSCKATSGPTLPGVPSYCFWPTTRTR